MTLLLDELAAKRIGPWNESEHRAGRPISFSQRALTPTLSRGEREALKFPLPPGEGARQGG
jgi:hypothetical protein